jgi:hypothetical protein
MAEQPAGPKPVDLPAVNEAVKRTTTAADTNLAKIDERLHAARGIALGVLISVPIWMLIAIVLYLLL